LPALSASVDTVRQTNSVLGMRMGSLLSAGSNPPGAGYGAALEHAWVAGFGNWAKQKDTEVFGYRYKMGGLNLGYDHEVGAVPGLTLGLTGSFGKGELENNDGLATTDIETFALGLYGLYEMTNGFFTEASFGLGWVSNDSTINKPAFNVRTKGSYDSNSVQAGLNLGYIFNLSDSFRLIPRVGLQYIHVKQDAWQEKIAAGPVGTVPQYYGAVKQNFLEIPVSLKLEGSFNVGQAIFMPELKVGGIFMANSPDSKLRTGLVGGASWNLKGVDSGRNRFVAGGGLKIQVNDYIDLEAKYELETRKKYISHYASFGLGVSF
jgi:outer membrane autotransporter protein